MDSTNTQDVVIGIDPASIATGFSLLYLATNNPVPHWSRTIQYTGPDVHLRLTRMAAELSALIHEIQKTMRIVAIAIENPSRANIPRFDGSHNHHVTQFMLGRAYDRLLTTARTAAPDARIIELIPADGSTVLGLARNASKVTRNQAACRYVGGVYDEEAGRCKSGALHGADNNALDAYCIGLAGSIRLSEELRIKQCNQISSPTPSRKNTRRKKSAP